MKALALTWIALNLLFMVRVQVAGSIRRRAIDSCTTLDELNSLGSFESICFDLTKWTYKQAYPHLAGKYAK